MLPIWENFVGNTFPYYNFKGRIKVKFSFNDFIAECSSLVDYCIIFRLNCKPELEKYVPWYPWKTVFGYWKSDNSKLLAQCGSIISIPLMGSKNCNAVDLSLSKNSLWGFLFP